MEEGRTLPIVWLEQGTSAARVRALQPTGASIEDRVRAIIARVRDGGDAALLALSAEIDGVELAAGGVRVAPDEIAAARARADSALLDALTLAARNVERVATLALGPEAETVELPQGHRIAVRRLPVRRAGLYVPGGRAAYPSTVVMGAAAARAAGVAELVVCVPPGPDGRIADATLAACALLEVDEVWRVGGAQAIAALAYGTETLRAVDLIAGPGNRWVQEAKRQVFGHVGVDAVQGPSELVVLADSDADPELVAADLLAQAEHGPDGLVAAVAPEHAWLATLERQLRQLAAALGGHFETPIALCPVASLEDGLALCEAIAPEHLELVGARAEPLAAEVRNAGCVFVGAAAATALGDYVAGSNHILPTGGAARFQSAVSAATFQRRMATVAIPGRALEELARAGALIARYEGLVAHARSLELRLERARELDGSSERRESESERENAHDAAAPVPSDAEANARSEPRREVEA